MIDIQLQDSGELLVAGGDFAVGESTVQHQAVILAAHQGEFKQSPAVGVGISDLLLSDELLEYRHRIRNQFGMDGMKVKQLDLYEIGNLKIIASYE